MYLTTGFMLYYGINIYSSWFVFVVIFNNTTSSLMEVFFFRSVLKNYIIRAVCVGVRRVPKSLVERWFGLAPS